MIYDIGFQRYRDNKFRVCGKDSIPFSSTYLNVFPVICKKKKLSREEKLCSLA